MDILSSKPVVSLNISDIPDAKLRVNRTLFGRILPIKKTYTIILDMGALRLVEQKIAKDLTVIKSWFDLKPADLAVIVWSALHRKHKTIPTVETVESWLSIPNFDALWVMLFDLCHPGVREALNAARNQAETANANPTQATLKP